MLGTMDKNRKRYIQFLVVFLGIMLGFVLLCMRLKYDRNIPVRVVVGAEQENGSEIGITVNVPKFWNDFDKDGNPCIGAEYDILVENRMKWALRDWKMVITLPEEARIDSSWNGEFSMEGNEIFYSPDSHKDIYRIKSKSTESLGMILISENLEDITQFELEGYRDAKFTGYRSFYLLLAVLVFWLISLAWYIAVQLRTRKLELQRIRDQKIIMETMQIIADFIDAKDEYTRGHSSRVSQYAVKLAEKLKMDEEQVKNIGYIAMMHDCGKMGIPDRVLNKPGKLTAEEIEIMRTHTTLGGKVLRSITAIEGIREGALYHHERYDGKGYPEGLRGEEIPFCARLICVADSFDAMNSDRCYRKRLEMSDIIRELEENMGKQFDPEIAKCMVTMLRSGEIQ